MASPDLFPSEPNLTWRAPTTGEHVCGGCRGAACYGLHGAWYCQDCVPAGFLPRDRRLQR